MLENAFIGRTIKPTEADLGAALGAAKASWDELLAGLAAELDANVHEWKCHSPKWGWSLRVLRHKRTIVWLSPGRGGFDVLFILGERAMPAARAAKLSQAAMQALDAAPKYPEGTGVRFVVRSPRSLGVLRQLAGIKVAN